ncbi:MAG: fused MFS/spermidine synthase, partial [Myxococcota bacterium]
MRFEAGYLGRMDDSDVRGFRHERALASLLLLFFVSGATALTYQTLWVRTLELVFGTSTFAISTVLAAFMLGLAIGGFAAGRYADRVLRPLKWYGLLEIGIGLYALAFPLLVKGVTPVYLATWRTLEPGPVSYGLIQFALVGVLLVVPTAMMGATLPLLARFATRRLGAAGDDVGTLYAVNTAGAVFGTWLCGFVLLATTGRFATTLLAAGANLALGLVALGLDRWAGDDQSAPAVDDLEPIGDLPAGSVSVDGAGGSVVRVVIAAIALAGFSALVYEVAWTRLLALMLGASTYTFSLMLLAFLVGIAAGGKLGGPLADGWIRAGGVHRVLLAFAAIEIGIAVLSYLLMYLYPQLPFWYVWVFDWFDAVEHPTAVWFVSLVIAGLIMTPPAVLMGMHFPIAVRAVIGRPNALGGPVGLVYGANTLGGVLGAFLAGFVLLPTIKVQGTIFVAAAVEFVAASILIGYVATAGRRAPLLAVPVGLLGVAIVVGSFLRPPWDPMLMTAGMYHYVSDFEDHSREGILDYSVSQYDLVFYEEGLSSVVTVAKNKSTGNMWLANNGKVDASTTTDMPTQVLCSLLPIQFAPDPKDVLVIGLASGVTAGAIARVDAIERLDVVELEPAIRRAALYFGEFNHDVLSNPKVNLITNDGRNHVLLTPEHTYDVIVSEPPNPWISGVANLFTKEFFALGKSRLKPGGVWSQWVQMYGMDTKDLRSLLRTFAEVYPNVIVYSTIEDADLVLVGSDAPMVPSPDAAARLFQWPGVASSLAEVDVQGPMGIVSLFQMDREGVMAMSGDIRLNTDDNMAIEYSAPLNLHVDTSEPNFDLLLKFAQIPNAALPRDPVLWADLARRYHGRWDVGRGVAALNVAASMYPEGDRNRELLLDELAEWRAEV